MNGDYMGEFIRNLETSLHKGFIDHRHNSNGNFKPQAVS